MDYMEYSSICSDGYASIREIRYAPRIYNNVYTAAHIIRAEIVEYLCDTFNNGIRKCLGSVKISPYIHKDNDADPYRAYSVTIKVKKKGTYRYKVRPLSGDYAGIRSKEKAVKVK